MFRTQKFPKTAKKLLVQTSKTKKKNRTHLTKFHSQIIVINEFKQTLAFTQRLFEKRKVFLRKHFRKRIKTQFVQTWKWKKRIVNIHNKFQRHIAFKQRLFEKLKPWLVFEHFRKWIQKNKKKNHLININRWWFWFFVE